MGVRGITEVHSIPNLDSTSTNQGIVGSAVRSISDEQRSGQGLRQREFALHSSVWMKRMPVKADEGAIAEACALVGDPT